MDPAKGYWKYTCEFDIVDQLYNLPGHRKLTESVQIFGTVYNWVVTIAGAGAPIVVPVSFPPGLGVPESGASVGGDTVSLMAKAMLAIDDIMDMCDVATGVRAYIKVQKYRPSVRFTCIGFRLIGSLLHSSFLYGLSVKFVEDGPAEWVEVVGGEGWNDDSIPDMKESENDGYYGTWEDALNAIQWAKGQSQPPPK